MYTYLLVMEIQETLTMQTGPVVITGFSVLSDNGYVGTKIHWLRPKESNI